MRALLNPLHSRSLLCQYTTPLIRRYATHRDSSNRARYTYTTPYTYNQLLKPLAFTVIVTATTFGAAYYLDTRTSVRPPTIQVVTSIIAINALVLGAHQLPRLAGFMARYACLNPSTVSRRPLTLLTSGFSHDQVWHFAANMVTLWFFAPAVIDLLGANQFLALYGSTICWSSMAHVGLELYRVRKGRMPRLGLGASGGICALFAIVAWYRPDTSVMLIVLPFVPIKLGYAFTGMIAMDAIGVARGWNFLGHAAHLGGSLTGLAYAVSAVPEKWIQARRTAMRRHLSRWGR